MRRKRFLNVIYFIDAHKTKSFSLSLAKLNVVMLILALVGLWSLASLLFMRNYFSVNQQLNERLHASLDTIFEYQSRYDGVYELAYPRAMTNDKLAEALPPSEAQTPSSDADLSASNATAANPLASTPAGHSEMALAVGHIESNAVNTWPVVVEDISFNGNHEDEELELNFAIRNIQSPERAQGYIWSVATLLDAQGQHSYIASPSGLKIDGQGQALNPSEGANWYSIRYYKSKSFYFKIPKHQKDALSELTIGMVDLQGQKNIYKLPIKKIKLKAETSSRTATKTPKG